MKNKVTRIKQFVTDIKQNKKLLKILWVICLILFVLLFIRYKIYKPMKLLYNLGVKHTNIYAYEEAGQYFHNALWEKHTKSQECKIRINEALCITSPISEASVTADNLEETIDRLEEAKRILCENGCANMDDTNGHNKKAQTLKEEIDEYIEYLKKKVEEEEEQKKEEEKNKEDKPENEDEQKAKEEEERKAKEEELRQFEKKQSELKEQFNKVEQEGLKERNETLELYQNYDLDFGYPDRNW